jgi:DNA-binding HxlR family transcriptional regulator
MMEAHVPESPRSGCPINLTLEVLGDTWSLLVIRDVMFGSRRHFNELLTQSEEGIASNILADRLHRLVANDMLAKTQDPHHKQRKIYSLTERSIQLVPVLATMGAWGSEHLPVTPELSVRAKILADGGPELWQEFTDELRAQHLGAPHQPGAPSVFERLNSAYQARQAHR